MRNLLIVFILLIFTSIVPCQELDKEKEIKIKDIKISGNNVISEDEIKLYIISKKGEVLNIDKLKSDVKRIYSLGHFKTVNYEIGEVDSDGYAEITILVSEIYEKIITSIEVVGNKNISNEILLSNISIKIGEEINRDKIRKSIDEMYSTGYLSEVRFDLLPYNDGTKIKFIVSENPIIDDFEIIGNTILKTDDLLRISGTKKNEVLNLFTLSEDRKKIEEFYIQNGYIAKVYDVDIKNIQNKATLQLSLFETVVEDIKIEGEQEEEVINEEGKKEREKVPKKLRTKEYVIKREIKYTKVGEVLDIKKVKKDLQAIYNLGYFQDISWKPEAGTKEDSVVVVIKLTESPHRGQALFGASYSSSRKLAGSVSVSQDNLFGKGRKISITSEFGGITSYSVSYFEPWADKKNTSVGFEIFNTVIKREQRSETGSIATYDEKSKGGNITLGRPVGNFSRVYAGFESKDINIVPKTGILDERYLLKGKSRSATLSFIKDTRDNIFNATEGLRDSASIKSSGGIFGGDITYTKYEIDLRRYRRIKKSRFIFAQRMQFGLYYGTRTPAEEFIAGGAETIRGYDESLYSGTKLTISNTEIRFPIAENFTGCVFFDFGNTWVDKTNIDDFKKGTGLGIRFLIPGLGPIRLDYGYNLQEKRGQIHFSFGQMF